MENSTLQPGVAGMVLDDGEEFTPEELADLGEEPVKQSNIAINVPKKKGNLQSIKQIKERSENAQVEAVHKEAPVPAEEENEIVGQPGLKIPDEEENEEDFMEENEVLNEEKVEEDEEELEDDDEEELDEIEAGEEE